MAAVAACLLGGCQSGPAPEAGVAERLDQLVHQYRKDVSLEEIKAIVVVSEEGCVSCNKSLAKLVESHLEDSTALVWVSAMGNVVDLTPFRSNPGRVVWDYGDSLRALGLIQGSGAIFLEGGRIDTVVQVEARTLEISLSEVADRLSGRPAALPGIGDQNP